MKELREVIERHGLTRAQAAALIGVSLDTVHAWLRPSSNRGFRNAPSYAVELLDIKARVLAREAVLDELRASARLALDRCS